MKSNQEKLANIFSSSITGAPYIFFTDEYRKGSATREPADLAWYVKNSVILIYLKQCKTYPDPEKRKRKTRELNKQNLGQAAGWLDEWKKGRSLGGRNRYNDFDIPYSKELNVIILSVYNTGEFESKIVVDFSNQHNVSLCAELPEKALELMAMHQLSPVDIIHIIKDIYHLQSLGHEQIFSLSIIQSYIGEKSRGFNLANPLVSEELLSSTLNFVKMRGKIPLKAEHYQKELDPFFQLFNDLSIDEYLLFARNVKECVLLHTADRRIYVVFTLTFKFYTIDVIICNSGFSFAQELVQLGNSNNPKRRKNLIQLVYLSYNNFWTPIITYHLPDDSQLKALSRQFFD